MKSPRKGYTLLFAVIVSSVVLSIAVFILSISRKQFIISSASRDSIKAVYAADSGIQCAVEKYNDLLSTTFSCNNSSPAFAFTAGNGVDYSGMNFDSNPQPESAGPFKIYFPTNGSCASVIFASGTDSVSHLSKIYIESRGYNMGDGAAGTCPTINPRAVERAIYLVYY